MIYVIQNRRTLHRTRTNQYTLQLHATCVATEVLPTVTGTVNPVLWYRALKGSRVRTRFRLVGISVGNAD
jgi:hypothetical protein